MLPPVGAAQVVSDSAPPDASPLLTGAVKFRHGRCKGKMQAAGSRAAVALE